MLSDEHFTVDGTLLEAWARLKSFQRKDAKNAPPPDDQGNATVDLHGEKRSTRRTNRIRTWKRSGPGWVLTLAFRFLYVCDELTNRLLTPCTYSRKLDPLALLICPHDDTGDINDHRGVW